jgi:hypothetical protein
VSGNDKLNARIEVLKTICDTLEESLKKKDAAGPTGYLPCNANRG